MKDKYSKIKLRQILPEPTLKRDLSRVRITRRVSEIDLSSGLV